MARFAQPVSMKVTRNQFKKDLQQKLLQLGYLIEDIGPFKYYPYLVTNRTGDDNRCTNFNDGTGGDKYIIDHYNPELFLAIAAMTVDKYFIKGEWYLNSMNRLTQNDFREKLNFEYLKPTLRQLINHFTIQITHPVVITKSKTGIFQREDWSKAYRSFDKKTLETEELMDLLLKDSKNEIAPSKIDKNLTIKCANEQEQELVKQWLIDNGESISEFFKINQQFNYIYFTKSEQWNNLAVRHTSDNAKTVTPQELGIIPTEDDCNWWQKLGIKFDGKWFTHPKTNTYDNIDQVIKELKDWKEPIKSTDTYSDLTAVAAMALLAKEKCDEFKNGDVVDAQFMVIDNWYSNYIYVDNHPQSSQFILITSNGGVVIAQKIRKPIKTVTHEQVSIATGWPIGSFRVVK